MRHDAFAVLRADIAHHGMKNQFRRGEGRAQQRLVSLETKTLDRSFLLPSPAIWHEILAVP